jgi:endo-1,4-beta-xylanase
LTAAQLDPPWKNRLPHRSGRVSITVLDADGGLLGDREVVVEQRSHAFSFGNIGFDFIPMANEETDPPRTAFGGASPDRAAKIADLWLDLFNMATLPFYWGAFEPQRGRPDTTRLHRAAEWFVNHGCRVKGHPLVWHTLTAD